MTSFRRLIRKSAAAADLLVFLVENMNDTNAVVVSQKALAELMGCSTRSIRAYVKTLVEDKWIKVLKLGTANVYHVNRECFWQQARNQRFYSQLSATVIVSQSEQEQSLEELRKAEDVKRIPSRREAGEMILHDDEEPPSQGEMDLPAIVTDEEGRRWEVNPESGEMQRLIDEND